MQLAGSRVRWQKQRQFSLRKGGRDENRRTAEERRGEGGEGNSEEKDKSVLGPWKGESGQS